MGISVTESFKNYTLIMNINAVVKLNYLVFFCAVMNFLVSIDPLIEDAVMMAYYAVVPAPIGSLLNLIWPFGYGTLVYFLSGVAIILNVDALSQVVSPADLIRRRMGNRAPNRLYSAGPQPPQTSRPSPRSKSHIADYVRRSTPLIYPQTNSERIIYTFPNEDIGDAVPPKAHKSFVVLSPEEIAKLEAIAEDIDVPDVEPEQENAGKDKAASESEVKKPPTGQSKQKPAESSGQKPPMTEGRKRKEHS